MGLGGGRPPKTKAQREMDGSKGRGSKYLGHKELPPLEQAPSPPVWMKNQWAIAEWNKVTPLLVQHGLLNAANSVVYATFCSTLGRMIEQLNGPKGLQPGMIAQFRSLANDFGLTPTSMVRAHAMGLGGAKEQEKNPFLQNKRKYEAVKEAA